MMKSFDRKDRDGTVIATCSTPLTKKSTGNGIPLLKKGAINLYMNMPCPLKVVVKMVIGEFAERYNSSHTVPIYSPMLLDGDSKGIEGELKAAESEEEIPEIMIAAGLHTVLSKGFKKRFIDSGIYTGITSEAALGKMPDAYKKIATENNIGIFSIGQWSIVCDLSLKTAVPYPHRWTDLVNPRYKDLITVHGYNGKASIAALLLVLREQLGKNAVIDFAGNIRNVWHFAEVLKRLDSSEPRRTPFNLLPNAATVQMPSKKQAAILEFEDGPVLAPMLMYVKTSRMEECRPLVNFLHSATIRHALRRGDFFLADEFDWSQPFSYPSWEYLMNNDYEELVAELDVELKKGLGPDVFRT
ncbi:MAG: ABC transporter substrate-binding protein [Chlorobiaceae bacterium]|nr:ABC transporter substrate-binding protein [Chlorobiaceae bacterium]NTV60286.1 ABC transporter substrate-binding protein [Chlorobiaceae bacterium]